MTYAPHLNASRVTMGRVTIEDNPVLRTVSITMTDLQVEDSDTYSCAYRLYSDSDNYLLLKTIALNVFRGEYLSSHKTQVLSESNTVPPPAPSPSRAQLSSSPGPHGSPPSSASLPSWLQEPRRPGWPCGLLAPSRAALPRLCPGWWGTRGELPQDRVCPRLPA